MDDQKPPETAMKIAAKYKRWRMLVIALLTCAGFGLIIGGLMPVSPLAAWGVFLIANGYLIHLQGAFS